MHNVTGTVIKGMFEDMTTSMMGSFFQPQEQTEMSRLRQNAILASNCMVLANYDVHGLANYYTDQIKVDWEKRLLVDTSSFDLTNQVSKISLGWIEPLTELNKTIIILNEVCQTVFERARGFGLHLSKMERKPQDLVKTYQKLTSISLFVFAGLRRMMATYSKHYNDAKTGFKELQILSGSVDGWGDEVSELYCNTIAEPCAIKLEEDNVPKVNLGSENNIFPLKIVNLSEVNFILLADQQYYESLYHLSIYDLKETADYSTQQIKACDKTKLLVQTGTWSLKNWFGELTSLDKTVVILSEHCERAKNECMMYLEHFAKAPEVDINFKQNWLSEVEHIVHFAMSGLKRMVITYKKKYSNYPDHSGLQELIRCSENLQWAEKLQSDNSEDI